jgi:hypothetical protein
VHAEGLVVLIDDRIQIRSDRRRAEKDKLLLQEFLHPRLVFDAFADRNSPGRIGKARCPSSDKIQSIKSSAACGWAERCINATVLA